MTKVIGRRHLIGQAALVGLAVTGIGSGLIPKSMAQDTTPLLKRIKMATIGAGDVDLVVELYTTWLDYEVAERGTISADLAGIWGAPKALGQPYVQLRPQSGADVYIRVVGIEPVPGYKAMTTWGWNSIEIVCDEVDDLYEKLKASPFEHIGGPANLGGGTMSIRAVQFKGPAEDVMYLTTETGDRQKSPLPLPGSLVDRPFIMVVAGPDIEAIRTFYREKFNVDSYPPQPARIGLIARAQGLPEDHAYPLTMGRMREHGNNFEIDGYPDSTVARPRSDGHIPPGVAITSVTVDSLDGLDVEFVSTPATIDGIGYNGRRAGLIIGPVGEWLEIIEE